MSSCLDNIVTLGLCDTDVSTSGLTLMQAAGMSPMNANKIATEQYVTGVNMLTAKKQLALTFFRNDFTGTLQANRIVSTITQKIYDTCYFNTGVDMGLFPAYRGVILNTASRMAGLKKLKIKAIQCYPLQSGTSEIVIKDFNHGVEVDTVIPVTFVANQLNTFVLPSPYVAMNNRILILTDNTSFNFAQSVLVCGRGCSGSMPNECAWGEGYNGATEVRKEGYGFNIQYLCECDYDSLICDFAQAFTGELIWLKWQELVWDEQYNSNRFTSWVIYSREDIRDNILPDIRNRYAAKYNSMLQAGMLEMLKQYNDSCLNCRGVRQITNI